MLQRDPLNSWKRKIKPKGQGQTVVRVQGHPAQGQVLDQGLSQGIKGNLIMKKQRRRRRKLR